MKILFSIGAGLKETMGEGLGSEIGAAFAENARTTPEVLYFGDKEIAQYESVSRFSEFWPGPRPDSVFALRWKRKRVAKYEAEFQHAFVNKKGTHVRGHLVLEATYDQKVDWEALFLKLCGLLKVDSATLMFYEGPLRESTGVLSSVDARKLAVNGHMICPPLDYLAKNAVEEAVKAGFPVIELGNSIVFKVSQDLSTSMADSEIFAARTKLLTMILNG